MNWQNIEVAISDHVDLDFKVIRSYPVAGGSINASYILEGESKRFFVKLNEKKFLAMFSAEAEGLIELAQPAVIRVPSPVVWGEFLSQSYIVMEYIQLSSGSKRSASELGVSLANLHKTCADNFGWKSDNTIGLTPQINSKTSANNWVEFYRDCRLHFQIKLARKNGCDNELSVLGGQLCENLNSFFESYQPESSLLHGDLWSGNYGYDSAGQPVIFDPAVYFGDRETDIAMTELFGGFSSDFYESYNSVFPLNSGYSRRKNLYNLYHVLNHFNLFGGGYQQQAISMMRGLLKNC